MAFSDVSVNVTLSQPTVQIGFGIPALFVKGLEQKYEEFTTIDEVLPKFGMGTAVYKWAAAYFAQPNHPQTMAVVSYTDLAQAYQAYSNKSWYFGVMPDQATTEDDLQLLSNLVEGDQFRMVLIDAKMPSDILMTNESLQTLLDKFGENSRTVVMIKKSKTAVATDAEEFSATLIGTYGASVVGSLNWHDLKLPTLSADSYTMAEMAALDRANIMAFVNKTNNVAQTTQGKTMSGQFIDVVMGIDWVSQNIKRSLQDVLTNNDKVTYDAGGIAVLTATADGVLATAFNNGIIDRDDASKNPLYTVESLQRDQLDPSDVAKRVYKGLSYTYTPSGAIDTVTVHGQVNLQ